MILITSVTLFLSLLAVALAIGAWRAALRGSGASLLQQYKLLSARLELYEATSEKLSAEIRNMRAARAMAAGRERRIDGDPPASSQPSEDEKARIRRELNAKLARGNISPLRPAG